MIPRIALLPLASATLFAGQFNFDGYINLDFWQEWELNSNDEVEAPNHYANHDLYLSGEFAIDEGLYAQVSALTYSSVKDENGDRVATPLPYGRATFSDLESSASNWELFDYSFNWNFTENGTLSLGKFVYAFGELEKLNALSYAPLYSAVIAERSIYGLGVNAGGIQTYLGYPDTKMRSLSLFSTYEIGIINNPKVKFTATPMLEFTLNQGRNRNFILGSKYHYSSSFTFAEYAIDGSLALLPHDGETTWAFNTEPSINFDWFSIGGGYYHALLAYDNRAASRQTDMPAQQIIWVEPVFELISWINLGFPYSWHNASVDAGEDTVWMFGPALYMYPTENADLRFFIEYQKREIPYLGSPYAGDGWATGFEATLDF